MARDVKFVVLGIAAVQLAFGTHVDAVQLHVVENFVHQESHPEGILVVAFVALVRPQPRVTVEVIFEASKEQEFAVTAVALEPLGAEVNLFDVFVQGFDVRKHAVTVVACLQ